MPIRASLLLCALSTQAPADPGLALIRAARTQIGVTLHYDSRYQRIPYPGGDVPLDRGVCTDVVIRAYRVLGVDLQALVHEDMLRAWSEYPKDWGMKGPDSNIDHRRVPNLATFFRRHGQTLATGADPRLYRPGDIVTWRLSSGVPHIGIVSDQRSAAGTPLMIHNIGYGTEQDDVLFDFTITGHFRYGVDRN
ncbi:MAG TPA: DUF1287 domain-containing protein [Holophagaceae bacterium]|jgi:uncharacterized protein YijF (DUF1287 family)|nr:DUF1287 domain-containing protein [Holophagaceae bacterium]